MSQLLSKVTYLLSWSLFFGLAAFAAGAFVSPTLRERIPNLPDDWWSFMFPVGFAFGLWFGFRSANWRRFHYASLVTAACTSILLFFLYNQYWIELQYRKVHPKGPFSGFGALVMAYTCRAFGVAMVGLCIGCAARIVSHRPTAEQHATESAG